MGKKKKILWGILVFNVCAYLAAMLGSFLRLEFSFFLIDFLRFWITPALLLLHAIWTLGMKKGVFFLIFAATVGQLMEILGLYSGTLFGGHYIYRQTSFMIAKVPVVVPLYWAVFIYIGYSIVNSLLLWTSKSKPNFKSNKLISILPLVIFDGLIVTIIDLFMDPIMVSKGRWTWIDKGLYFGVPIGNFLGWFLVTVITTTTIRLIEYFHPTKVIENWKSAYLMPTLGYSLLAIVFTLMAVDEKLFNLIPIGLTLMGLISVSNIYLYLTKKN